MIFGNIHMISTMLMILRNLHWFFTDSYHFVFRYFFQIQFNLCRHPENQGDKFTKIVLVFATYDTPLNPSKCYQKTAVHHTDEDFFLIHKVCPGKNTLPMLAKKSKLRLMISMNFFHEFTQHGFVPSSPSTTLRQRNLELSKNMSIQGNEIDFIEVPISTKCQQ